MKHVLIFTILLFSFQKNISQISCCVKPNSNESFAMLTKDRQFILSHLEPEAFQLINKIGKDITFTTPTGKNGYAYEIKAAKNTENYLFVFHEWWGLTDHVREESEKLFNTLENVNVIAIDLYNKKVADNRDSAGKYMNEVKTGEAEDVINGAIKYIGNKANISTIGWCFGGGWSLQAAILAGKQTKACVMYYGMPEEKNEKIKKLNAPVMFIFAEQDKWINKEVVEKFEAKMKEEKKQLEVKSYDAVHGFANPSNPKYAKQFADEAFKYSVEFIKKNLK
jgi:carboxymethylenebutenolidase